MSELPTQPVEFLDMLGETQVMTVQNTPASNKFDGEGPDDLEEGAQLPVQPDSHIEGNRTQSQALIYRPVPSPITPNHGDLRDPSPVGRAAQRRSPTSPRMSGALRPQHGTFSHVSSEELRALLEWAKKAKEEQQLKTLRKAKAAYD